MKAGKLIFFIGILVLFAKCHANGLIGKTAPALTVRQWVTEQPPKPKELLGRVWVVEFWATWCPPCVKNVDHLKKITDKYHDRGFELIALSQDKSTETVSRFVREKKTNYHVAIDNGTVDWFYVSAYPTVVVINHLGKVTWTGHPWNVEFEKAICKALAAAPPLLLTGVDLGPFKHLKDALWGGKDFAESYHKIKAHIDNPKKTEKSKTAKAIIDTIDKNIAKKIQNAQRLRPTNSSKAYRIFDEIVTKYGGIELVKPAKNAYIEMKKLRRRGKLKASSQTS